MDNDKKNNGGHTVEWAAKIYGDYNALAINMCIYSDMWFPFPTETNKTDKKD